MTAPSGPAILFDLDGTLVDSVYQHVLAWREALEDAGIELSVWRIHRRIGMSGGLFVNALLRETGHEVTAEEAARLQRRHVDAYRRQVSQVRPLPGARELLAHLSQMGVPWAIATSGRTESAGPALELLGIPTGVPVVTRDQVAHAKPDPDLFVEAAARLGWTSARRWSSETACGICSRHAGHGRWVLACYREATGRTSSSKPEPIESTRIQRTC